ncbi:hypothetical protein ACSSS7_000355 [Eimeria intestinalis]
MMCGLRVSDVVSAIFGKQGGEIVNYNIVKDVAAYEIREYPPHVVIEEDPSATFKKLADYLGVFEEPQNKRAEKISMTTPVECLVDRAEGKVMRFFPPLEYKTPESLPEPLSSGISIYQQPTRYVAVRRFSGSVNLSKPTKEQSVRPQLLHVTRALLDHGVLKTDTFCDADQEVWQEIDANRLRDGVTGETVRWSLALYNPPFCLPFLRRNEIWLSVSSENAHR